MAQRTGVALAVALCCCVIAPNSNAAEAVSAASTAPQDGEKSGKIRQSKVKKPKATKDATQGAVASENAGAKAKSSEKKAAKTQKSDVKTPTSPETPEKVAKKNDTKASSDTSQPEGNASGSKEAAQSGNGANADADARPWAAGVSQENQQVALKLFRDGNALLKDSVFAQAAIKYREALSYWDHPAIHYNLVLALLNMDKPLEVLAHLEKAMAYGAYPIDTEKYEQAKKYKTLTESQLSHLTVQCDMEGAVVSLDGQELFVGPGKYEGYVRPGPHSIVAKKEGYMNNEVSPALIAGGKAEYEMVLLLASDNTEYKRRWAQWKPWSVFAGGIVVAGVGAALHLTGRSAISKYDEKVSSITLGSSEGGIVYASELQGEKDSGARRQKIAMGLYGVGGAAIATGSVLLYLNRSRPYNPDTGEFLDVKKIDAPVEATDGAKASDEEKPTAVPEEKKTEVSVLPLISSDTAGFMASFRF